MFVVKKIKSFFWAMLFVVTVVGIAQAETIYYSEDGTGLVPDNEWTNGEVYTFLGGLTFAPGTYELRFELHGTAYNKVGKWDKSDKIYVQILVNGNSVAFTTKKNMKGSRDKFSVKLEVDISSETSINLSINSWSKVSSLNEVWLVRGATLRVSTSNAPPVADAGPNKTVDEGSAVTLNGSNSFDPDFGDSITYQWIQTGGNPTVTLNGANTATPSFTAPNVGPGGTSLTFELTVTDLAGLEDSDTTVVNVSFVNQPPMADAGPNQTKGEETEVTLDGSNSSDPDDGIKSYRWSQKEGPKVRLSNDEAVKPTFTAPNVAGSKSLKFTLTVTDFGGLKDTDTTIVNVTGENDQPTADAGPDQTKEEEIGVALNGSNSSDPDDGIKSYRWSQKKGPPVTLSNPQAKKPTFKAPNVIGSKSLTFELTVTDFGSLKDTDTTIVNVTGDNDPPVADAGPDQAVDEEEAIVELYGAGSRDPDDGIKSYRWSQTAGPQVTLSNPLDAQPTFTPPNVLESGASLTFELIVTDMGGLENVDAIIVNVTGDNDPPTANAGVDQTVFEKSTVALDGSNSFDSDDGVALYRWKQVAGPSVTFSDPTIDRPTFEAPSFDDSGDKPLIIELIVTDEGGLQSSDSTTVSVSNFEKDNPGASGGGCFITTAADG
jgi:nucleoside 2-deoxyribosyltransferase